MSKNTESTMRPDPRPASADGPAARAALRAAEIRAHRGDADLDGTDEFHIDPKEIPEGWSYEWKMKSVIGKEDPSYGVGLANAGWEPVPASRHPGMMPKGSRATTIERKGMILMERPLELTLEAQNRHLSRSRAQVKQKEQQLTGAPGGQFERANKGDSLVKIGKSYEPVQIPE